MKPPRVLSILLVAVPAGCTLIDNPLLVDTESATGSPDLTTGSTFNTDSDTSSSIGDTSSSVGDNTSSSGGDTSSGGAPTCDDGLTNGDETDVDCGGSCGSTCQNGESCVSGSDCQSDQCSARLVCEIPSTCGDGILNVNETDIDCGGPDCEGCDSGEVCIEGSDCISGSCNPENNTCLDPACDDGIENGDETDLDCGGLCGPTCEPGEGCVVGGDCISQGCDGGSNTCNDYLSVDATPLCSSYVGMPVSLSATAMGGSGIYIYAWTPDDGTLTDPGMAMTDASPVGSQSYTVTADDGFAMAQDTVTVVDSNLLDLQNCTLYQSNFDVSGSGAPATINYDMMGARACETGNNEFGLHLCENLVFENTRLQGVLEVSNDPDDDGDWMGFIWGAQDNANFYSLTWKRDDQVGVFSCDTFSGITVRRVEAPDFASLTIDDFYCLPDTPRSTLLLDPSMTTMDGWVEDESYTVTIDFTDMGSDITVTRDSDMAIITNFMVNDNTFTSGFFGSTTASQEGACTGPIFAECL